MIQNDGLPRDGAARLDLAGGITRLVEHLSDEPFVEETILQMIDFFHDLDESVFRTTIRHSPMHKWADQISRHIEAELSHEDLNTILGRLASAGDIIREDLSMHITVASDVSKMDYRITGGNSGTIQSPVTLVHKTHPDDFLDAFGRGWMFIEQDGTQVIWRNSYLWPPSIDAFHMLRALKPWLRIQIDKPKTVVNMGCGTGFLGYWVARTLRTVEHLHQVDVIPIALLLAAAATPLNHSEEDGPKVSFSLGSSINAQWHLSERPEKVDILVSNPPYLPLTPEQVGRGDRQVSIAGLDLLEDIIKHGPDFAKVVVVNFSEICRPEVDEMLESHRRKLRPVDIGKVNGRMVGLRLPWLEEHPDMLQRFISDDRRGIEVVDIQGVDYLMHRVGCWRVLPFDDE